MAAIDDCIVDPTYCLSDSFRVRLRGAGGESIGHGGVTSERQVGEHCEVEQSSDINGEIDGDEVARFRQRQTQVGNIARIVAIGRPIENAAPRRDLSERRAHGNLIGLGHLAGIGDLDGVSRGEPQCGADESGRENDDDEPLVGGEVHILDSNGRVEVHGRAVRVKVVGR